MMVDRDTERYARNLDRVRNRRGPQGDLIFLGFTGAHEFTEVLVVTRGWFAEPKKRREQSAGQGKPMYLAIQVAELAENILSTLLKEEWRLAVAGVVYTIDKDYLTPPTTAPLVWHLDAYHTDDTYLVAP